MNIGVCMKQVPDTASNIVVSPDGSGIQEAGLKMIISPYDEFAIEEALKTKEKLGAGSVTVFSFGPKRVQEALRTALAMGVDKAVHIESDIKDPFVISKNLAQKIKDENIQLVFVGRQAVDDDNAQIGGMIAAHLNWGCQTQVSAFELQGEKAILTKDADHGNKETWEMNLPLVLSCTKGLNQPRYASLKGIMQAKTKPLSVVPAQALEPKTKSLGFVPLQQRKAGKIFEATDANIQAVVQALRTEAKVV